MCLHCDALDDTDRLITFLNKLLGTKFPPVEDYKYAAEKFKDDSMYLVESPVRSTD